MSTTSRLRCVSKTHPCPICAGDHKCGLGGDGLILCGRVKGDVPGYRYLGPARNPIWERYRPLDDRAPNPPPAPPRPTPPPPAAPSPTQPKPPSWDWPSLNETFVAQFTSDRRQRLADLLNLPSAILGATVTGFDSTDGAFTFPEYDGLGHICGILKRYPDGSKRCVPGSRRGIILPWQWDEGTTLFIVEGPSDVLALTACGLHAIGRPSNLGGADFIAALVSGNDPPPLLVVVGENDRKADGSWPGRDGAVRVAENLAQSLKRSVRVTFPQPEFKDVRDWVVDRWQGSGETFDWKSTGDMLQRDLLDAAVEVHPKAAGSCEMRWAGQVLPRRWALPVPIQRLASVSESPLRWLWDGFLARDAVTLLSALPKCGKTTLLGHLLAALPHGGDFVGRRLTPGRALVVSEEPASVWALRQRDWAIADNAVMLLTRGVVARANDLDEWTRFVGFLAEWLHSEPCDLVVFDTLANLWPCRDENSATEVTLAMTPLHRLAQNRSVLLLHHLRKSDGAEGTASRGSGAIAGFVDVIVELRRQRFGRDPQQRHRLLTGYGRFPGIPTEWPIELTITADGRSQMRAVATTQHREDQHRTELQTTIRAVLSRAGRDGSTFRHLWEALPPALRSSEKWVRSVLNDGVDDGLWLRDECSSRQGGPRYRVDAETDHPDADPNTEVET